MQVSHACLSRELGRPRQPARHLKACQREVVEVAAAGGTKPDVLAGELALPSFLRNGFLPCEGLGREQGKIDAPIRVARGDDSKVSKPAARMLDPSAWLAPHFL
jgi:hypothetical protein